jgi:MFS family permease
VTAARRFGALAHRDFALFWAGNVLSRAGSQMRDVAVAWHLYLLTNSPMALGLVGLARAVPIIVLAMVGGVAADAFDRRRIMMVTQSLMAVSSAGLAVATHQGVASPALLWSACRAPRWRSTGRRGRRS